MRTVNEVAKLSGVTVRTLQYYDKIGLLKATVYTDAGYRLYDDQALERLQQILLFRELEFPLKDIAVILGSPDFDRRKALRQQIELLTLKKERLERLIDFARDIETTGGNKMDFKAFDSTKLEEYAARAKKEWGSSAQFEEFEKKNGNATEEEKKMKAAEFMAIFKEFGEMKGQSCGSDRVKAQVEKLRDHISGNYYTCTDEILLSLGKMYSCDGEFKENIDAAGGEGTAEFVTKAIETYLKN